MLGYCRRNLLYPVLIHIRICGEEEVLKRT